MTRRFWLYVLFCISISAIPVRISAGTTGGAIGRVLDETSHAPVAGARVTVTSPSQTASSTTDAAGNFRFLSLVPDTYTIAVEREGFEPSSQPGVSIIADQTQTLALQIVKTLKTIGRVSARGATSLVKPGTTSDVYSINAAGAEAAQALGGPGSLNSSYGAIASVPGTVVQQGQQGWYQTLSIRGGDIDQVGYELDGIPANRVYDNAPQTMLSSLGQQELQVYTGGTPASADASGIAGYVNQVVKSGTYPGFATLDLGLGSPAYYHKASFEAGGATKNRLFSYYVGFAGVNEDYRYADQFNGVSDPQLFYPVYFPEGHFNLYDGTPGTSNFAPGSTYAISNTTDRENVANLHFAIPHKNGLRDDVQLLYLTSEMVAKYYSSVDDQGGLANVSQATGGTGQAYWHDGYTYNGALFTTPSVGAITPAYFPNSPTNRAFGAPLSNDARDYSDNGVAVTKLQYQHAFDEKSYLRLFGYTEYSNWFIGGPANQQFTGYYGAELNDYELPSHTFGLNASYSNQLSDKHLLQITGSYTAAQVQRRFSYGFSGNSLGHTFANYVGTNGLCYDPTAGTQTSCFGSGTSGVGLPGDLPNSSAYAGDLASIATTLATNAPAGSPAAIASARWLATDNGYVNSRLNKVSPAFTAGSITDQWHPNARVTVNVGARFENYDDRLADTTGDAARAFWFAAYNNENCYKLGAALPQALSIGGVDPVTKLPIVGSSAAVCKDVFGTGSRPANLVNQQANNVTASILEPRLGATYTLSPYSVLRASYGVYARAVNTSWLQYDAVNSDLASFIGGFFLTNGYNTPVHDLRPDTSNNFDFSLEHQVKGTDLSFKLTPFYRATKNQLQPVPIGVGGTVSGFNVGQQTSQGIELAVRKGDFARDGFAAQLAYTYTRSRIKYKDFPSGTNVIDGLNQYIQEYNSYTSACAKITARNSASCGIAVGTANPNASATFASANAGAAPIRNPYYDLAAQPLFDRNGSYTTYDQIPQVFTGENGYETPDVLSMILNYKHGKFSITPTFTFSSGAKYGSPLAYPGYVPTGCTQLGATGADGIGTANPRTCSGASAVSGLGFLVIPDAFTGRFDNLGAFQQPARFTMSVSSSYAVTKNVKLDVALTSLVDTCFQRGYAWDDSHICVYSQLPSGGAGLGPSGNFLPLAGTPVQFKYPYGVFNNNLNTGFEGTTIPLQAAFDVQIKL